MPVYLVLPIDQYPLLCRYGKETLSVAEVEAADPTQAATDYCSAYSELSGSPYESPDVAVIGEDGIPLFFTSEIMVAVAVTPKQPEEVTIYSPALD